MLSSSSPAPPPKCRCFGSNSCQPCVSISRAHEHTHTHTQSSHFPLPYRGSVCLFISALRLISPPLYQHVCVCVCVGQLNQHAWCTVVVLVGGEDRSVSKSGASNLGEVPVPGDKQDHTHTHTHTCDQQHRHTHTLA